jgi:hypothetical protein
MLMAGSNIDQTQYSEIRIAGHLDQARASQFAGMRVTQLPNGESLLCGPIEDQAALFGILLRLRDLGIPLLSLNYRQKELSHRQGGSK